MGRDESTKVRVTRPIEATPLVDAEAVDAPKVATPVPPRATPTAITTRIHRTAATLVTRRGPPPEPARDTRAIVAKYWDVLARYGKELLCVTSRFAPR